MIGGGTHFQVSGLGDRLPGSGAGSGNLSSVICHRFSPPCSSSYVVTRSRPYPARRSREVEAV